MAEIDFDTLIDRRGTMCSKWDDMGALFGIDEPDALARIPGAKSMKLQSTYLAWVDFSGMGLSAEDLHRRVEGQARIAANHGESFGLGGECWMRFNLATPSARIHEAVARLRDAFKDLQ